MKLPPETITKIYYTIGEVAIKLQVANSCVRYWSNKFDIEPLRSRSGVRKFSREQVDKLKKIKELVDTGYYTLEGVRKIAVLWTK